MNRFFIKIALIFLSIRVETTEIPSEIETPLFISLGSFCDMAEQIRNHGLRHGAFPFDWILSLDHNRFPTILREEFANFLEREYLIQPDGRTHVINTYYNIDFRHDWHHVNTLDLGYPAVKEQYDRRIKRFRELKNYKGKVYFFRLGCDFNHNGPHDQQSVALEVILDSYYITHNQAKNLKVALDETFPNLDFELIIIHHLEDQVSPIGNIPGVSEFTVSKWNKTSDYKKIFDLLHLK